MMTPKEVREHGFPRSRKGYDMAEVDDFLDKLTDDYSALYNNYGKLSNSYAKLRKKAQALVAALEQAQSQQAAPAQVQPAAKPAAAAAPAVDAAAATQSAVDEILRAARKDAEAIRSGAERERQDVIAQATNYAAENAERLKNEVAAEEARLAAAKKATATYVSQVRQLMGRQAALLESMPVSDEDYAPAAVVEAEPAPAAEAAPEAEAEPTVRVPQSQADVADEISRNMLSLSFDDESDSLSDSAEEPTINLDVEADNTSLFDAITTGDNSEFDEE